MTQAASRVIAMAWHAALWSMLPAIAPVLAQAPESTAELSGLTIEAEAGQFSFQVEVADTAEERNRGLMFRRTLASDHGMLFDFGQPRPVAMWMRNTFIPLDMLFLDQNGFIEKIVPNTVPLSEEIIRSDGPVRAVLELRGGITKMLGIEPGDRILHPLFSAP